MAIMALYTVQFPPMKPIYVSHSVRFIDNYGRFPMDIPDSLNATFLCGELKH